ncbi:fumarylacetoacetate hydrolase family protein [Pseudorhodobacter sp. MZDSW-24AT]|uniref:fumarylacetoacetate hydrolase family protein n=1 Tax=Pseudorhodobacter sp. MZDSW-24AT TaxID=2052957 RepID=UPI000C1E2A65|nr:fumarylacetoacetate hydrolase family protein [Pseudorhodobacter sp. MZDSW-24AT]PJF09296.1 fumarylacetoacetate hydrolase [Pseudorhodobacter sp. MZDSW-24AT]
MDYLFDPLPIQSVAVEGESHRFPLRRIFCVGRNYADHIREMGFQPEREPPFFFTKPIDALVQDGETVAYPPLTENFHHEAELVVAIGKPGADIPVERALDHVYGYAVGNDLTRRDVQFALRDRGRPWDWSKAFDRSAVVGTITPSQRRALSGETRIHLSVNDEVRQDATLKTMIWSVAEIIAALSNSVTIRPGDLVFTGTPAGVGPLTPGDICTVSIDGLHPITTVIGPRE